MSIDADRFPVIIGIGQVVDHWPGDNIKTAPNPVSLMVAASRAALADTGQAKAIGAIIDVVCAVRTTEDSLPMKRFPFKTCDKIPLAVSAHTGLYPKRAIYSGLGGEQPQALINEWAKSLYEGGVKAVLITGGEATNAMKLAMKNGHTLEWPYDDVGNDDMAGDMEDRGGIPDFITPYEMKNGLGMPPRTYALLEKAFRHRLGMNEAAYRRMASELLSAFSKTAAANPYAQFTDEKSADFLETESPENFKISDVYLKWHVAQDAVNQGATLILTTAGQAKALGVDPSKYVYVHGHASLKERMVSERPDISHSAAVRGVLVRALENSSLSAANIDHFEIYSCFPVLVFMAAEYLGVDWRTTPLTQTGGLPFFGGPGNNYSAHGIASLATRLRQDPGSRGLVLANGGFISKLSAAVYSTQPPKDWQPVTADDLQSEINTSAAPKLLEEDCAAVIESYVVSHNRGRPNHAFIIGRTDKGRVLAQVRPGDDKMLEILDGSEDFVGQPAHIKHEKSQNFVTKIGV